MANHATYGSVCVLAAAMLWGTTGTAAALAPGVGSLAVGAAAMGIGGLLQAAAALRGIRAHRIGLAAQWKVLTMSALATAIYPLAFYSSMRLAGVAVGTVVSIGSAPAASAVIERIADKQGLSRRWAFGAAVGVGGVLLLAAARTGGEHNGVAAVGTHPVTGILLGLLAGLTYALYSWGAARMMRPGLPPRPVMGAIFGIAAIPLLPILILTGAPIIADAQNLAAVAYLAVVPMFLGYLLFGKGLAPYQQAPQPHSHCSSRRSQPLWPSWCCMNTSRFSAGSVWRSCSPAWRYSPRNRPIRSVSRSQRYRPVPQRGCGYDRVAIPVGSLSPRRETCYRRFGEDR
jgi:DME family drug/metabolite transporter